MNPSTNDSSHRHQGRILVVDDEPQMLALAKAILESNGMEVVVTDSGEKAVSLFQEALHTTQRYSVVILDLTMPGGSSGFEVMEEMLRHDPNVCVIACSGYFQEDARSLCQAIGFADVLQKPYTLEHLVATVRRGMAYDRSVHGSWA